ncbi:MAG: ParB/RepB/Spo0J family partition protein [Candidatus Hadarchaeum sp.]|uniref:ParB/RepB/Spo0J family partition protein n=1 Tax=Candidatus Hadarchaeum sp. TaxID=2883567 RepID=UPI00316B1498
MTNSTHAPLSRKPGNRPMIVEGEEGKKLFDPLSPPAEGFPVSSNEKEQRMELRPWDRLQQILPPLSESEQRSLAESIRREGAKYPVLALPDGRIIDGYHRWKLSGGKASVEIINVSEDEAFALGIELNIVRRHLSLEQIREIRQKCKNIALELRKQGKTQAEVAAIVGVVRRTVGKWENISNGTSANAYIPDLRLSPYSQTRLREELDVPEIKILCIDCGAELVSDPKTRVLVCPKCRKL